MDFITNILDKETKDKINRLEGFGVSAIVCPGHDLNRLVSSINAAKLSLDNKPKVIIADTIKGFGLKCMENVPKFHFRIPTKEELSMGKSYEECG
jgi:transketolase